MMIEVGLAGYSGYECAARGLQGEPWYRAEVQRAHGSGRDAAHVQIEIIAGINGGVAGEDFVRVKSAHQPVQRTALAGQAYFFARLLEVGLITLIGGLLHYIDAAIVDIVA